MMSLLSFNYSNIMLPLNQHLLGIVYVQGLVRRVEVAWEEKAAKIDIIILFYIDNSY